MLEEDSFQWNYNTIWYGRTQVLFKFLPENLQEGDFKEQKVFLSKEAQYLSP